jgi:hypothetical protein
MTDSGSVFLMLASCSKRNRQDLSDGPVEFNSKLNFDSIESALIDRIKTDPAPL